jgi:uncharacterized protein (TIGR02145 family)
MFAYGEENQKGKFTDPRDGNVYEWVKIGSQVWMAENLRFKTSEGSWCWKNQEESCEIKGRLYHWNAAIKAAPPGWHLPSDEEWKELEISLGLTREQADLDGFRVDKHGLLAGTIKKKNAWPEIHKGKPVVVTNESGFSAIQTGIYSNGSFDHDPYTGWWTSSGNDTHAWIRHIGFFDNTIGRVMNRKHFAFSVRCVKDKTEYSTRVFDAAAKGHLDQLKQILKGDGTLIDKTDRNGKTPLHHAVINKRHDMVRYIIKKGANLDIRDEISATPLHYAAHTGDTDLVTLLLDSGSDALHSRARWKKTPLHVACERGYPNVVSVLLDRGADMEARTEQRRTALISVARESGSLEVIKMLIDRGADINARDISDDTALTLAAWRGFEEVVNYLIMKKSVIPEEQKWSALWMAAENNLSRLYHYLIERGLRPEQALKKHPTLIHYAAAGGSVEIVSSLVKKGFDPLLTDKDGWTPLHYAASQGENDIIEYLIKYGIDKNSRNKKGETAYHLAVFREFPDTAKILKKMGVDSNEPAFPDLKGPYMGQPPPGDEPELFLPGIVSGHYDAHCTIVFSPDGKEACWTEMYPPREKGYGTGGVMTMKMVNNRWTYPVKSEKMKGEPFFSPDGKRLYFLSIDPLPGDQKGGKENIWYMNRTANGWSEPVPVDQIVNSMKMHWQISLDKRGNLYFADWNRIYYAEKSGKTFKKPVDISQLYNNPTLKGFCPFISPEGDYLIFSSKKIAGGRNTDLYISFKKKDGTWTDRIHLGDEINASLHDIGAFVSPDGKYLFFTSVGKDRPWGIYWVDAGFIERLRSKNL